MPTCAIALAAYDTSGVLKRVDIERRDPQEKDVDIVIKYCGVCHSDLHHLRAELPSKMMYPMIPGHEIAGIVRSVGTGVTKFKVGDRVGVGCFVDSCRECGNCAKGLEQYCVKGMVTTYNCETDWYGRSGPKTRTLVGFQNELTFGGYSQSIVVDENYVVRIPDTMELQEAAPLLCAGVTTYSPLVYYGPRDLGTGCTTGIVGFGGLGHMATKIARAMGNKVVVLSSTQDKQVAAESLGAKFVCTSNQADMKALAGTCDFILDTISDTHDLNPFLETLTVGGMLCLLGMAPDPYTLNAMKIIHGRKTICGSLIGGIQETQEMLNFCAQNNIASDVTVILPKDVNHAMNALAKDWMVTHRYVIDIENGLVPGEWEVEDEPEIDPKFWTPKGQVVPSEALNKAHPKQQST